MAKNNKRGYTIDSQKMLVQKWLYGGKLTAEEMEIVASLIRQYPQLRQLKARTGGAMYSGGADEALPGLNRNLANRNSSIGGSWRVSSPGGFKKSGIDEDSARRKSGITDQRKGVNTAKLFTNGSARFGDRTYTSNEVKAIIKRAQSGATLGVADQAVYDRYLQIREDAATRKAQAQAAMEMRQRQAERNSKFGIPMDRQLTDDDYASLERGTAYWQPNERGGMLVNVSDIEKARENAGKANIERMQAALRLAQKSVKDGTHEYSRKQIDEMENLQTEMDALNDSEIVTEEERAEGMRQLRAKYDAIASNPHRKLTQGKTDAERIADIRANGGYYQTNGGEWKQLVDANKYQAGERERVDKWLDSRINDLMKETRKNEDEEEVPVSYQEAYNQAISELPIRFPDYKMPNAETGAQVKADGGIETPAIPSTTPQEQENPLGGIVDADTAAANNLPDWKRNLNNIRRNRGLSVDETDGADEIITPTEAESLPTGNDGGDMRMCQVCGSPLDANGECTTPWEHQDNNNQQ